MLTSVMCYATTVCSTRVVRVGLCVHSFGRGFLPTYESREVSTEPLMNGIVAHTMSTTKRGHSKSPQQVDY